MSAFGESIIRGAGFAIGAALMVAPLAILTRYLSREAKAATTCPGCGAELPDEVICVECGERVPIMIPRARAILEESGVIKN